MTELVKPNPAADFELRHQRSSDNDQQLPTPLLTPLVGSPLLQSFAPKEEAIYESLEDRLNAPPVDLPSSDGFERSGTASKSKDSKSTYTADDGPRQRSASDRLATPGALSSERVLKLSPQELKELTLDAASLPVRRATPSPTSEDAPFSAPLYRDANTAVTMEDRAKWQQWAQEVEHRGRPTVNRTRRYGSFLMDRSKNEGQTGEGGDGEQLLSGTSRPHLPARTVSTPPNSRRKYSSRGRLATNEVIQKEKPPPSPSEIPNPRQDSRQDRMNGHTKAPAAAPPPMQTPALPLPPLSLPTFLQLELDAQEPSQLYIYRPANADFPYESSAVKFERLENFLLLPGHLEGTLIFGAAACFDAWLYNLTILPIRFCKALAILVQWWLRNAWKEMCDLVEFVYLGVGRLWRRNRSGSAPPEYATPMLSQPGSRRASNVSEIPPLPSTQKEIRGESNGLAQARTEQPKRLLKNSGRRHRRTRSTPSLLMPNHKADILKGFLIICSSFLLLYLDPSRMYHNIRGQAAIKLYVIYNMLEVADKLLGSIGQDILECLFSRETLERKPDGRSKVLRPFSLFILSLIYNVIHASALFYQVITLNVAVNSYSNALLTLLMSNQFVEIKGSVFKKFEKENLFQMCCADVVERFQLLLMLLIIAMRNIVEVGGISISISSSSFSASSTSPPNTNATGSPFTSSAILPRSFNILPSFPGKVLTPFLIVICSEMVVDWLKYAYINKFNNYKPNIFGRFFDVLAKDYYTHAFSDQNLTRRIGLPVFPLTCLFIRASVQTYHMLIATYFPPPVPSPITGLAIEDELPTSTPATTAAFAHIDRLLRRALGRSDFSGTASTFSYFNFDDFTAIATTVILGLIVYLLLLAFKLVWGMFLLAIARRRYMGLKVRETEVVDSDGKRIGGWGSVELGDERRKVIYEGDEKGLQKARERDKGTEEGKGKAVDYSRVRRYDMVAKRIW
ncbi:uncharacterized protein PV09_09426 [Verruconis gallopava]|uniref:Uncharacterized protein n=1 Tax=Verruconis gallopava TaxID=253628 RepID=A0A0D1ZWD9_9PEZI|nr:uncharacterized protein PV09_09426 [Verruconis gallopava]KIV98812.1 hypothetical protein PV09_09426 [Verruconis gallopava]